jgi:hypothetical protein
MNLDMMVFFLGVCAIIWIVRSRRKILLNKKVEFELYQLRDKLRLYEFEGQVKPDSWSYDYLDKSICKTIDHLNEINIYTAVALNRIHKKDSAINEFKDQLNTSVSESKRETEIYAAYKKIVLTYVFKKHKTFSFIINSFIVIHIFGILLKKGKKDIENFTVLPETSASGQFMNNNGFSFS